MVTSVYVRVELEQLVVVYELLGGSEEAAWLVAVGVSGVAGVGNEVPVSA